jgi:hypothetical protein
MKFLIFLLPLLAFGLDDFDKGIEPANLDEQLIYHGADASFKGMAVDAIQTICESLESQYNLSYFQEYGNFVEVYERNQMGEVYDFGLLIHEIETRLTGSISLSDEMKRAYRATKVSKRPGFIQAVILPNLFKDESGSSVFDHIQSSPYQVNSSNEYEVLVGESISRQPSENMIVHTVPIEASLYNQFELDIPKGLYEAYLSLVVIENKAKGTVEVKVKVTKINMSPDSDISKLLKLATGRPSFRANHFGIQDMLDYSIPDQNKRRENYVSGHMPKACIDLKDIEDIKPLGETVQISRTSADSESGHDDFSGQAPINLDDQTGFEGDDFSAKSSVPAS